MFKKDTKKKVRETMNLLADLIDELAQEKITEKKETSKEPKKEDGATMNNEEKISNTKYTTIVILLIISLLFSFTSLSLTIYNLRTHNTGAAQEQPQVVISTKYDKGQSLDKAIETKKPILVLFYADWCGYCQRFAPTFHKIAKDPKIKKNFAVAYVNCDAQENGKFVQEYGIDAFPTVYVVDKNGQKTKLDNNTFFNENSKIEVRNKALELINAN